MVDLPLEIDALIRAASVAVGLLIDQIDLLVKKAVKEHVGSLTGVNPDRPGETQTLARTETIRSGIEMSACLLSHQIPQRTACSSP